jgi:hypothetical protein
MRRGSEGRGHLRLADGVYCDTQADGQSNIDKLPCREVGRPWVCVRQRYSLVPLSVAIGKLRLTKCIFNPSMGSRKHASIESVERS